MSVDISPIGGAAAQFFDNNGVILSGGKLYTYAAGTTTPKTSYTNVTGVTPHSNPIILDSAGRVPGGEIWLTSGEPYKFVLETPTSILLGTWDNIYGYTSGSAAASTEVQIATAGQTLFVLTSMAYNPGANTLGVFIDGVNQVVGNSYVETSATSVTFMSGLHVGAVVKFINLNIASTQADVIIYNPGFVGSVTTTVGDKLEQYVSVKDFGAVGDGVTNDTVAIQAAVNNGTAAVYVPATTTYYKITNEITVPNGVTVYGDGWDSLIRQVTLNKDVFIAGDSNTFRALRLKIADGDNADFVNCIYAVDVNNLSVLDCFLESGNLGGVGVHIRGVQNSLVRGNRIYNGQWNPTGAGPGASAADILLYSFGASERHIIDGNFCLSNNSQGIFIDALGYDGDILVSNNICVTLDPTTCTEAGTWSLVATGGVRRHGIVIGYNNSSVSGPRTVVSGNVCRNTRWTGIYKQGVSSGPVIIANNICDLNGYDTANSLSGGIYFVQSGYEEVIGNYISRFQNTNTNTGGVTVNASTAPVISASVRNNTIQGSLGKGVVLTTNASFVEVAENTLLSNVGNDIDINPNAGNANIAGHNIVRNRIVRTSGSAVTAVSINLQASTRTLVVKGNRITGNDNTTVSDQNSGIRIVSQSENARVIDNELENFYYGFYSANYYTTGRSPNYIYERNTVRDCNTGFVIAGTTGDHTVPVVDNRFVNVTTQVGNAGLGATVGRIVSRLGDKFTWQTTAAPAVGAWDVGDRSSNSTPVVGQPKGWMCTVAGTPGTWVSEGNL